MHRKSSVDTLACPVCGVGSVAHTVPMCSVVTYPKKIEYLIYYVVKTKNRGTEGRDRREGLLGREWAPKRRTEEEGQLEDVDHRKVGPKRRAYWKRWLEDMAWERAIRKRGIEERSMRKAKSAIFAEIRVIWAIPGLLVRASSPCVRPAQPWSAKQTVIEVRL